MDKKVANKIPIPLFVLVIMISFSLSLEASDPIVENADTVWSCDLNTASPNLTNVTEETLPRPLVEYSDTASNFELVECPEDLVKKSEETLPRPLVEYSDTAITEFLSFPKELMNDTIPPKIANVKIDNITQNSVAISWETDELASSILKYGKISRNYTKTKNITLFYKEHALTLYGLSPLTTYYFIIICTDQSGNLAESKEYSFTTRDVDKIPPSISYEIDGILGNNKWFITNVSISFFAEDDDSGIAEFKYNVNGEWHDYIKPINLSEGIHTIKFYAKDNAGNNASDNISIKIDKTKPTSVHTLIGIKEDDVYITDVTVQITSNDDLSGIKQIMYKIDGNNWIPASDTSISFTVTSKGIHTIEYYSIDNAGNIETQHQINFEIVKNSPPIADFYYTPTNPRYVDIISFCDQSTDEDGYIVSWQWNFGDGNTSNEKNPKHRYAKDGTYNVILTVTDDDGAKSSKQKIIIVRNISFIFIISPFKEKYYIGETYKINWSSQNAGKNVKIELYKQGKYIAVIAHSTPNNGSYSWEIPTTLEKSPKYKIKIVSLDNNSLYDYSDYFEIANPIRFMNPNINIKMGETLHLQWKSFINEPVSIYLYKGDSLITTIAYNISNISYYSWKLPDNIDSGKYEIKIVSAEDSNIYDYAHLTIKEPWTNILWKLLWMFSIVGIFSFVILAGKMAYGKYKKIKLVYEKEKEEIIERIKKIIEK